LPQYGNFQSTNLVNWYIFFNTKRLSNLEAKFTATWKPLLTAALAVCPSFAKSVDKPAAGSQGQEKPSRYASLSFAQD
jgi:hypothetical protein